MSTITKKMNVYVDSEDHVRRILWDTIYVDAVLFGYSPVPFGQGAPLQINSAGVVIVNSDFLEESPNFEITDITVQTDEATFCNAMDDVNFLYESDDAQTYETDFHEVARQL